MPLQKTRSLTEIQTSITIIFCSFPIQINNFIQNLDKDLQSNYTSAYNLSIMKSISNGTSLTQSLIYQQSIDCFKKIEDLFPKSNTPKFSNGIGEFLFDNDIKMISNKPKENQSKQNFLKVKTNRKQNQNKTIIGKGHLNLIKQYQNIDKQLKKQLRQSFKSPAQMEQIKKQIQEIELKQSILNYFVNVKQDQQKSQFSFSNKGACAICNGQINMNQSTIHLGCNHHFHSICIENQQNGCSMQCPICPKSTQASQESSENRYESKQMSILQEFQGIWDDSLIDNQENIQQSIMDRRKCTNINKPINLLSSIRTRINYNVRSIQSILSQIRMVKKNKSY